jgi:predicted MFS family arabinose efflux permease
VFLAAGAADRWPVTGLPATLAGYVLVCALTALIGVHLAVSVIVLAVWGAAIGLLPAMFQTRLLREAVLEQRTTAGAIGVAVLNLGIAVGAWVGGVVLDRSGPAALPVLATVLASVAAAGGAAVGIRRTPRG